MSLFIVSCSLLATAVVAGLHELVWLALDRRAGRDPSDAPPARRARTPRASARAAGRAALDGSPERPWSSWQQ